MTSLQESLILRQCTKNVTTIFVALIKHAFMFVDNVFKNLIIQSIQDRQVSELAKDLANKLGLKIRKAYVSPQVCNLDLLCLIFVGN